MKLTRSSYRLPLTAPIINISSATVPLAAKALHCEENRIAKTLSFCSPFAVNEGVEVYLDISLKRFATVFPACGSSNSAIELSPQELEKYSGFIKWIDVCKIL